MQSFLVILRISYINRVLHQLMNVCKCFLCEKLKKLQNNVTNSWKLDENCSHQRCAAERLPQRTKELTKRVGTVCVLKCDYKYNSSTVLVRIRNVETPTLLRLGPTDAMARPEACHWRRNFVIERHVGDERNTHALRLKEIANYLLKLPSNNRCIRLSTFNSGSAIFVNLAFDV